MIFLFTIRAIVMLQTRDPQKTLYLISCVSKKRKACAQAKDLYISDWFLKTRKYVERTGSPWFIVSAKYWLVHPDRILAPYEQTLNKMGRAERLAWAARVKAQMETDLPDVDHIVVLAGRRYREFLMDYLRQRAKTIDVPMEGLGIGKQLHYLTEALHHEPV
jgi:hypothetical protein